MDNLNPSQTSPEEESLQLPAPTIMARKKFKEFIQSGGRPVERKGFVYGGLASMGNFGALGDLGGFGALGDLGGYDPKDPELTDIQSVDPFPVRVPGAKMDLHDTDQPGDDPNAALFAQNQAPPDASIGGIPIPGSGEIGDFNPDDYLRMPDITPMVRYVGDVGMNAVGAGTDWLKDQYKDLFGEDESNIWSETTEVELGPGDTAPGFENEDADYFHDTSELAQAEANYLADQIAPGSSGQQGYEEVYGGGGEEMANAQLPLTGDDMANMIAPGSAGQTGWEEVYGGGGEEMANPYVDDPFGTSAPSWDNINWGALAGGAAFQGALGLAFGGDEKDVAESVATSTAIKAGTQAIGLGAYSGPIGTIASELINGPGKGSMANIAASGVGALASGAATAAGLGAMASTGVGLIPAALVLAHGLMTNKMPTTRSIQHKEYGRAGSLLNEAKGLLGSNFQAPSQDLMNRFTAAGQDMTSHDSRGTTASEMINFLEKQLRDQYGTHNVQEANVLKNNVDLFDTNFDEEGGLTGNQELLQQLQPRQLDEMKEKAAAQAAAVAKQKADEVARAAEAERAARAANDARMAQHYRDVQRRAEEARRQAEYAANRKRLEEEQRRANNEDPDGGADQSAQRQLNELRARSMGYNSWREYQNEIEVGD